MAPRSAGDGEFRASYATIPVSILKHLLIRLAAPREARPRKSETLDTNDLLMMVSSPDGALATVLGSVFFGQSYQPMIVAVQLCPGPQKCAARQSLA